MPTQTHTVTIAQALASTATGLLVADSAANIAGALPNPSLLARVVSFTVSAPAIVSAPQLLLLSSLGADLHAAAGALQLNSPATLSAAQLAALEATPGFAMGPAASITLSDSTANVVALMAAHPTFIGQVAAINIHLDGTSIGAYPASQLNGYMLHGKTVSFSPPGGVLTVGATAHDLGSNAAALDSLGHHQALAFSLITAGAPATIIAADAAGLTTLTGFSVAAHPISVADSAANIAAHAAQLFGQGFAQITATSGTLLGTQAQLLDPTLHFATGAHAELAASATVSGAAAAALAGLPSFTLASGVGLIVQDTAANLAATAASWSAVATGAALSTDASGASAVTLTQLASLPVGLNLAGHSLGVSDTLASLLALPSPAAALATSLSLSGNATATVAQLTAFAALPHVSLGGFAIAVTDTAANLLGLSAASLTDASSCTLAASATVNTAQFGELRALPGFSVGSNALTVTDSAANLASLSGSLALVGSFDLAGTSTVDVAQLTSLAALPGFSLAGHSLSVVDTAAQLLTAAPGALALAASVTLSQDATVTAAQSVALYDEPGFSAGAAHLTISDSAANLVALPHGLLVSASTLALSANQSVTAATLTQLAGLGIKFDEAGHTVTCADTAANLAGLSQGALSLAGAEILTTTATVSAATALALAALPNLSAAAGTTLTVQDSVTNLLADGQSLPATAMLVQLPPGTTVSLSAAQAQALAAIPHFSAADATITVADTLANLTSIQGAGWQDVAAAVHVTDTAANLAANAESPLVQSAATVSLSANAQVSAAAAAQIAGIPHFSASPFQLSVLDTASNVAAHASAVIQLDAGAIVSDSGPITAAVADQLATVSTANLLTCQSGDQLLVRDSYAALTSAANATGLALAARLGVLDTAANLVVASNHDWGALNPSYTLSNGGTITASQATVLASLGSHYDPHGFVLSVADTAGAVTGAAAALTALGITATVSDSTGNLAAYQAGLLGLGTSLTQVHDTDTGSLSAAAAASISALAAKLSGPVLQVVDSAANVASEVSSLSALGTHVAVLVVDTAADVAPVASGLATLQAALQITLTDLTPVDASVAAALVPVISNLAAGTFLAVTDTAAAIFANASALSQLGNDLGPITLSDGTVQSAALAAGLASLASHFAAGVTLSVVDTGADVTASEAGLHALQADQRLGSVTVANTTVLDATTNVAALNRFGAEVTISDTGAAVDNALGALSQVSGLSTITLTDSVPPQLSMTVATLQADFTVLAKIVTPYSININDTAADITADLAAASGSIILSHLAQIGQITTSDAMPLMLTQTQLLAPHVDDGAGSALAKFGGMVEVVGVDLAHLAEIAGLGHAPSAISVADSSAAIAADLSLGAGSVLLASPSVVAITSTDHASVSLTANQVLAAGVDNGSSSALAKLTGASLSVTDATIAQLPTLAALDIHPTSITISDTAADIAADLAYPGSLLVTGQPIITAISVQDGQTITLTEQQVLAAHVDDGINSVLSETTGGMLAVTGVKASDIAQVLGLSVHPASIEVSDTAAQVAANLSTVVADRSEISSLAVTDGPVSLTAAETLQPGVDDGAGSLIAKLTGQTFVVTDASVAELSQIAPLPYAPSSVAIVDNSANISADLSSGSSVLSQNAGLIGTITVTGTLTLTAAQAAMIASTPALDAVMSDLVQDTTVSVLGATVAQVALLASVTWPHLSIAVADSAANIAADLDLPGSVLLTDIALLSGGVTLTAGGVVDAQELTLMASLPNFSDGANALSVQDGVANILSLASSALAFATSVVISDTATNVYTNLDALQARLNGQLSITLTDASPSITVSAWQYCRDRPTLDAITNHGVLTVTGTAAQIAPIATELGSDMAVGTVAVTDSAADIIGGLSNLSGASAKLAITLTDTTLSANLLAPLLALSGLPTPTIPVVDTGSQIAQVVESGNTTAIAYLNANGATLSGDSIVSAADAAALESLTGLHTGGHTLLVWDTAAHLTAPAYQSALTNADVSGVYLKAPGNVAVVTAATAAALYQIPGFDVANPPGAATTSTNTLKVSDTAAHIDTNFGVLNTEFGQPNGIASIMVNASATITVQTLDDLQSLGATTGPGVNLTVRDTASTIANALLTPHDSITPYAWTLSGSGTATEAQAALLGSTANFSAAGNIINLTLLGNTPISLADANALGNIASALDLGGNQLIVAGTVAQLSSLSSAACSVVTCALTDSLPHILALSPTSPLLSGTVEVTGSDEVDASDVETFLSLIHSTGTAPGIVSAQLTIDSSHYVNDSVANLRALASSTEWIANPNQHMDFTLVARDTIDALTDPNNTNFLSDLAVTGLSADATVSAASAASLAALATTIHYQADHAITVQDTAASLLNPFNAAGLAFANTVELSGPTVVDAADAESLLSMGHFDLNTSLTISDNSANLLDGSLTTAIDASADQGLIRVELAGPETLDADTAETLVSLPHFTDVSNLSIADSSSYLLNSANLTAEQMATSVTLAGDETVSANTVYRLSQLPHFNAGTSHLDLAGNDFANAVTLKAIADDGTAFVASGHTITVTEDALDLSPTEFANLQSDNIISNGHVGVLPGLASISDTGNTLSVSADGYAGGVVQVYGESGSLLSSAVQINAGFTVTAADAAPGQSFAVTETVNGVEGAPLIVLDASAIETAVSQANYSFASSGNIEVDSGKFLNLYDTNAVPNGLSVPALVYNPTAHTVSLDVPGSAPVTLITLGGTTHPASLDLSEIIIKHHG